MPSKFLLTNRIAGTNETVNGQRIRCYDNGGRTADRYTVLYMDRVERETDDGASYDARGMNAEPFHPQGIGMSCSAMPGRHLGRRVLFADLPTDCRRLIEQDTAQ